MDQATLDGCFEKVRRAEELRGELERIVETFANTNPYPAWVEGDRNTGQYSIFIDYSPPPPIKMAVVFGEHLHDLRSALDHLAWREAIEFIGRNPTKREERAIYFPLRKSRADFRSAEVLRYVSKDARAILERHQPYKRGQGERPKALALLAWFSNEDKHRTLPMTPNLGPIGELRVRHRSYAKLLSMSEVFSGASACAERQRSHVCNSSPVAPSRMCAWKESRQCI